MKYLITDVLYNRDGYMGHVVVNHALGNVAAFREHYIYLVSEEDAVMLRLKGENIIECKEESFIHIQRAVRNSVTNK